ncbi:MAG TPA: lactonase family protein [Gemmataceae bacterium]|nr:lactonase family protein [Gemmataceae bacterium]
MTVHSMTGEVRADPQIAAAQPPASTGKCWVYVGTYTEGASKGIYRFELDLANGNLTSGTLAAKSVNPSFLAIDPAHRFLYAVNEVATFGGKSSGAVSAFFIDPRNGNLTFLNQQPSEGSGPCHIVIDSRGKYALVANYGGGNAVVLPIQSDGRLAKSTAFVQHQGSGTNPNRQGGPHAHSINLDAANRFAFIADLGLDKIVVYKFDARLGTLVPNDSPSVAIAPGSGPRHFAFHPNGRTAYVINELQSTVTAFRYDPAHGVLKAVQTISTLPMGFTGESSTAEVQVHPSGKFLYGSNRGHDSIAIFAINPATGGLKPVGHQANQIKTPRNFGIDPTGNYMLVANQDGNSIVVFRIDLNTGELSPTGVVAEVPTPVCVKIIAQER